MRIKSALMMNKKLAYYHLETRLINVLKNVNQIIGAKELGLNKVWFMII
jgi:hypothetical protein